MYRRILVAVENSLADKTILAHVRQLATLTKAEILLVHVADGWAARNFKQLALRESDEIKEDRAYLESLRARLSGEGLEVQTHLAMGDPSTELVRVAQAEDVDLIAMTTHGHRFLADILHGATADRAYLERIASELTADSLTVQCELAMGDPANELIRLAEERNVDLIAMSTHGHRFFNDLLRGTTVSKVRHFVKIPVLLLRAQ